MPNNLSELKVKAKTRRSENKEEQSLKEAPAKGGEYRIVRIGKTATKFILFVVYTMRGLVVRLISARQASRAERNLYIERKFKAQSDENTDD